MATKPAASADDKTRDRARTQDAILAAAREVLVAKGFGGWGVNAIARAAGCDKQLIYRYFGGLDGLAEALGTGIAEELERALSETPDRTFADYAELVASLLDAFIRVLRAQPIMQRIIAWELSEPTPLTSSFAAARGRALGGWIARVKGNLAPPPGMDAPATNAVLIAAVQHVVLASRSSGAFAGIALSDETDWTRLRSSIRQLVYAAYRGDPVLPNPIE